MIGPLLLLAAAGSTVDDGWPPRGHYRRDATAQVHFVDQAHITGWCDAGEPDAPGDVTEACQEGFTIYLPNPCNYTGDYARLACHELAHLNGWPNNHPHSRASK